MGTRKETSMKKGIMLLYSLTLLLVPCFCFGQSITIAAARIEPIGVREETARLVDELITTALTRREIFTVIERRQIESIIGEQKIQQSGITDTSSAVEAGGILNADKILLGSIGKYESKYVEFLLSLRLIDVEKAEVEIAESIQIKSAEDLPEQIEEIIRRLTSEISVTGKVTGREGDTVYISLGSRSGLTSGDILSVYRIDIIKDDRGTVLMREDVPLANLRAETVQETGSRCVIIESSEPVEKGFYVRQGQTELGERGDYGSISVGSIPEGARVFLENDFLGETPLTADPIPAGEYHIEIRAGGYKPYHGVIKLRPGRSVSIERELEQELEVEDLILLGKVPRRATDPSTALKKAFLPGQGLVYNGYRNLGLVMPAQLFTLPAVAAYLIFTAPSEAGDPPDPAGTYWTLREYYRNTDQREGAFTSAAILAGYSVGLYAFSIVDSMLSADDDFLYPVYLELSFGGCGGFSSIIQTPDTYEPWIDDTVTGGLHSLTGGGFFELAYMGRKYHFLLGLDYQIDSIIIRLGSALRFKVTDSLFIGPGAFLFENFLEPDNVDAGTSQFNPSPGGYSGPMLHAGWRPSSLCLDMWFSPYIIGTPHAYAPAGSDIHSDTVAGITGTAGGIKLEYCFSLSSGVRFSADVYSLFNNTSELANQGFTTMDTDTYINIKAGMVYRF